MTAPRIIQAMLVKSEDEADDEDARMGFIRGGDFGRVRFAGATDARRRGRGEVVANLWQCDLGNSDDRGVQLFITGATGFIGRAIVRRATERRRTSRSRRGCAIAERAKAALPGVELIPIDRDPTEALSGPATR